MKPNIVISLFIVFGLLGLHSSCLKDDSRCITQTGPSIYDERELSGPIDSLVLDGDVNLHITKGDKFRLYLKAGEKLLPGLTTIQTGRLLTLTDENKCDFLRDMGAQVDIYLTIPTLRYLKVKSSGIIETIGQFKSDSLVVESWGGGGSMFLDIDVVHCWIYQHGGNVDFTIKGAATFNYIYWISYAPIDCSQLETGYSHIVHKGTNNIQIKVNNVLHAEIHSIGDVIYNGSPSIINVISEGTGKLRKAQ
jgi:hypothetical protein